LLLLLAACDTFPADRLIGVSGSSAGRPIIIRYASCSGSAGKVSLEQQRARSDDYATIWEIQSTSGTPLEAFPVGTTPEGFAQVVPLAGPIATDRPLFASVTSRQGVTSALGFKLTDLRDTDQVLVDPRHYHEFYLRAKDFATTACE
jgi:hypothetical protein